MKWMLWTLVAFAIGCAHEGKRTAWPETRLAELTLTREVWGALTTEIADGLYARHLQAGQSVSSDTRQRFVLVVSESLPHAQMLEWTAAFYGEQFSDDELEQLASFADTPTGRKALRLLPHQLRSALVAKLGPVLVERLPRALLRYDLLRDAPE